MADVLDIKSEVHALALSLHGAMNPYTAFVLVLYRRKLDGTQETALATNLVDQPDALKACASVVEEHSRGEIDTVTIEVQKPGSA